MFCLIAPIWSEVWEYRSFHRDYEYLKARAQSSASLSSKKTISRNVIVPDKIEADEASISPSEDKRRIISFKDEQ